MPDLLSLVDGKPPSMTNLLGNKSAEAQPSQSSASEHVTNKWQAHMGKSLSSASVLASDVSISILFRGFRYVLNN